jgi:hypothetical protein
VACQLRGLLQQQVSRLAELLRQCPQFGNVRAPQISCHRQSPRYFVQPSFKLKPSSA